MPVPRLALASCCLVLAAGCQAPAPASQDQGRATAANAAAAADPPPATTPKPEPKPKNEPKPERAPLVAGPLLAIVDGALIRLDDAAGIARLGADGEPIHQLRRGPAGRIHALRGRELVELVGDTLELRARVDAELEPPTSAVLLDDHQAWVSGPSGVSRLDGEGAAWTTTSLAELELEASSPPALGLDGRGRVWLVAGQRVLYHDGQAWVAPEVPPIPASFALADPRSSPQGLVHVTNRHRLTRLDTRYFDSVLLDPRAELEFEFLAVGPSGHAALASADCELGRVDPKPPTKIWRFAAADHPCTRVDAITLDARLRIWVASDHGLSAITDARRVRDYPRGSVPALDGQLSELLALAGGPTKLLTQLRPQPSASPPADQPSP